VDRLLDRPEYVDYWSLKWGDLLRNDRQKLGEKGMWSFYNWLRAAVRENRPVDQLVRELITAQGSTYSNGPANFFRLAGSPPHPLEGAAVDDPVDRRRALAAWLTSKENRFFARNFANRLWGYVMGRGIVEPVDDLRATNPPSNPALLDALAKEFVDHGFDQKQ